MELVYLYILLEMELVYVDLLEFVIEFVEEI